MDLQMPCLMGGKLKREELEKMIFYSVLIDKISGKGTWESNPYVFVYDFKLID